MRVVHVFKDAYPPVVGGIERHVHDVVHGLDGFEFTVLTSSRTRGLLVDDDAGVRVVRAPEYGRPLSAAFVPAWRRLLGRSGAHVVHVHMPNPFGELAALTSGSPAPVVASYHADAVGPRLAACAYRPLRDRLLGAAARIVVSSPRLLDTSPALARHRERAVVVPYGVHPEDWRPRPPLADELRRRLGRPLVLFLGRLVHYKGVEVLVRAMDGVDATLVVAGDGPWRPRVEAAIRGAGRARVALVGAVADDARRAYFHAADVFVLPSTTRAEAFGIAMLEAMACGTPAICTELGTGTSWLNRDGETGLVVPPADHDGLRTAIERLLGDEGRRRAMGRAAVRRVSAEFTHASMLTRLAAVYRSVQARQPGPSGP